MPNFFSFASHDSQENEDVLHTVGEDLPHRHPRRRSLFKNLGGLLKRHHDQRILEQCPLTAPPETLQQDDYFRTRRSSLPDHIATPLKPVPSLPRPQTFRRQESERRDNLLEVPCTPSERRTVSLDRRRGLSTSAARRPLSPHPIPLPSVSAPEIVHQDQKQNFDSADEPSGKDSGRQSRNRPELPSLRIPELSEREIEDVQEDEEPEIDLDSVHEEYDRSWILNLSMQFRDKSNREKFFVTYAETSTKWRRLTISLDYRNAPPDSLEADLSTLHFQRDKSFRIFEAIRESLPDIQYYNTVTNLKLETTAEDGQLHVHVREDANEIIRFPSISLFEHVVVRKYVESELEFLAHLSGFVYKVKAGGRVVIKKEIPGPDTVDEFLYEVNALESLLGCRHVVQLEGLVTDSSGQYVKGLLIAFAPKGALVDILYDCRGELPWYRREKWAKQIVRGLSDIHEAGFVQGDFTLSNIVIDENDDAQIIDINRRGCPVGWEPPELGRLIDAGQRISMCIGVKTDLYQLGMVLWALAEEVDEPERVERPLPRVLDSIPVYFSRIVETCLSERPQNRSPAKRLLRQFPITAGVSPPLGPGSGPGRPSVDFVDHALPSDPSVSPHRSDKEYIDPDMAVTIEDVNAKNRRSRPANNHSDISAGQVEYLDPREPDSNPASTTYRFESSGSWIVGRTRGRSPTSSRRRQSSPFARESSSSATSLSRSPPSRGPRRRGSDCSVRSVDSPVTTTDPPDAVADDVEVQALEIDISEAPEKETLSEVVQHKRINCLQGEEVKKYSAPPHTDSGFDETMIEGLDIGPAIDADKSLNYGHASMPPALPTLDEQTSSQDPSNRENPLTYQTTQTTDMT